MPRIGSFYNPSSPFSTMALPFLASVSNMRYVPSFDNLAFYLARVVSSIKTQVLFLLLPWPPYHYAIQCLDGWLPSRHVYWQLL
jgi:hypothetical protein